MPARLLGGDGALPRLGHQPLLFRNGVTA
jgi:hypothetical protein